MEGAQELEGRGCRVVMVGIGTEPNAKKWMESNSSTFPFPFLLDPEMKLFRELGLRRSAARVWTVPILCKFAERLVAGTLKLDHFEDDDVHMLAGDYITDASGKLLMSRNCPNSEDRPTFEAILAALDSAAA